MSKFLLIPIIVFTQAAIANSNVSYEIAKQLLSLDAIQEEIETRSEEEAEKDESSNENDQRKEILSCIDNARSSLQKLDVEETKGNERQDLPLIQDLKDQFNKQKLDIEKKYRQFVCKRNKASKADQELCGVERDNQTGLSSYDLSCPKGKNKKHRTNMEYDFDDSQDGLKGESIESSTTSSSSENQAAKIYGEGRN